MESYKAIERLCTCTYMVQTWRRLRMYVYGSDEASQPMHPIAYGYNVLPLMIVVCVCKYIRICSTLKGTQDVDSPVQWNLYS